MVNATNCSGCKFSKAEQDAKKNAISTLVAYPSTWTIMMTPPRVMGTQPGLIKQSSVPTISPGEWCGEFASSGNK